ncbi:MAG: hypothetical protein J6U40_13860, partial [Kiritimatiellae bacterium]|nr:hypothetical protein [Kiritimatiellia bacterium]
DTAHFTGTEMRFTAGGYVFTGSSILDCVELTDSENYTAALGEDGKTITVTLNPTVPATAIWTAETAPANADDLANPANWNCRDAFGAVLEGAVPGAKTIVIIPTGTTVFTLPLGYVPQWGGIQFGFGAHTAIQGGRINYGADRGGMTNYDWRSVGANKYALLDAETDPLATINSDSIMKAQLRFDGWFYVSAEQAGVWNFRQLIDDYCALAIDGDWILHVNSWNYQIFATRTLLAGWHRFSLICGDTYGGYGPRIALDDVNVPIAVSIPGAAAETPFLSDAFTLGNDPGVITLGTDCDWVELGPLTIANGVTLDQNGHNLIVQDITGSYLGAMITNSTETASTLTFIIDPEASDSMENLIIASSVNKAMDVPGVATAYWTGAGNDGGDASNPANWECYSSRGALLPDAVPTEATTITLQGDNINMQVPPEATLNGRLLKIGDATLSADCDWRGITLMPTLIGTLDLAGNNLQLVNLVSGAEGVKVVNSSTTDESEVRFTIPSGETGTMESKLFANNVKVVKEDYGDLTEPFMNFGDSGYVTFSQIGGTVTLGNGGDSRIGGYTVGSQGHGIYELSDGALTVNNNFQVGGYGTGAFIQSGGTVELPGNWLVVGRFGGSTGTYDLTGGTAATLGGGIIAGEDGTGTITVSGSGVASSKNELRIAANAGSKGEIIVKAGGTVNALNNFQVGRHSVGNMTQEDGIVTCDAWLSIGRYTDGIGLYTLTGGTYTSRNQAGVIGEEGFGTFDISGMGVADLSRGTSIGHAATGRGLLKVHDGGTLITSYIRQGPGRATVAFDGGTVVVPGTLTTVNEFFHGIDDVTIGPGGLTLDVGDNYVYTSGSGFGSRKMEGPITKTGTGSLTIDALPAAERLSVREGTLQLLDSPTPTLVHRWSFNGDFQDPVGGKMASVIGSAVAFDEAGAAVVLSGNGNSAGSLNLGTGIVPTDAATIDIWATRRGNANWSRIFDYGPNNQNYLQMGWVQATDASKDIVEVCNAGTKIQFPNTMAQYEADRQYHISLTVRDNGDGSASSVHSANRCG